VVYKAKNTYESWTRYGPAGAAYSCSPSGWFDGFTFTDWFEKIFLPHVADLDGKKILVGDNLSSHINLEVIRLCKEHDIL
jgi:DDE superfamily endonuclease